MVIRKCLLKIRINGSDGKKSLRVDECFNNYKIRSMNKGISLTFGSALALRERSGTYK